MAGIPPLAGFLSKFLIFSSAIQSNFNILALIGVVTSVIAATYYLRIINLMFFTESPTFHSKVLLNALDPVLNIDLSKSLILGSTLFFILFLLFYPAPL
jgi:NADH-quinone oxidoreductase subunit N